MSGGKLGVVFKYFSKPSVAAIEIIDGTLKVGDKIQFLGFTTDFEQEVVSMQINNEEITEAKKGDQVGLKTIDKVRPQDNVYKISGE